MGKPEFIVDNKGSRKKVIISIKDYEQLMDKMDELDAIKTFDKVINGKEESITLEQALSEIEQSDRVLD
ncbi:MAG: hypothetical protein RJQ09_19445 [Cyclobacteriaceae bacterium]